MSPTPSAGSSRLGAGKAAAATSSQRTSHGVVYSFAPWGQQSNPFGSDGEQRGESCDGERASPFCFFHAVIAHMPPYGVRQRRVGKEDYVTSVEFAMEARPAAASLSLSPWGAVGTGLAVPLKRA